MPKTKISEFDTVAANNTDIDGINLAEGMLPSDVNNAIRELMAQLKDFQTGAGGDSFNGPIGSTTAVSGAFTTVSATGDVSIADKIVHTGDTNTAIRFPAADTVTVETDGTERLRVTSTGAVQLSNNLTFTGTGNRITGDFSNATIANRVLFQTSTVNSNTAIQSIPNGTAVVSQFSAFNNSDPTNASLISIRSSDTEGRLEATRSGTGTFLPLTMYTGGSERLRIDTSGNVGIGTTSNLSSSRLDVRGRIRTGSGNSSGDAEIIWSNYDSATTAWNVSVRSDVGGANGDLKFLRFSSGSYSGIAMQIESATGNVGIGTSTPTQKLAINSANTSTNSLVEFKQGDVTQSYVGMGSDNILRIESLARPTGMVAGGANYAFINTNGTERMRIDSSGNVLIGTTTSPSGSNKLISSGGIESTRITPRATTTTSSATPTINTDNTDIFGLTAQAVDITSFTTNLSGTPTNGQKLWIYIVGTAARAITWGSSFEASTIALPTTTVSTNRLDVGFVWNATTSKWRCVAVA